jgi:hypothetical protein
MNDYHHGVEVQQTDLRSTFDKLSDKNFMENEFRKKVYKLFSNDTTQSEGFLKKFENGNMDIGEFNIVYKQLVQLFQGTLAPYATVYSNMIQLIDNLEHTGNPNQAISNPSSHGLNSSGKWRDSYPSDDETFSYNDASDDDSDDISYVAPVKDTTKVDCLCGSTVSKKGLTTHYKTQNHLNMEFALIDRLIDELGDDLFPQNKVSSEMIEVKRLIHNNSNTSDIYAKLLNAIGKRVSWWKQQLGKLKGVGKATVDKFVREAELRSSRETEDRIPEQIQRVKTALKLMILNMLLYTGYIDLKDTKA